MRHLKFLFSLLLVLPLLTMAVETTYAAQHKKSAYHHKKKGHYNYARTKSNATKTIAAITEDSLLNVPTEKKEIVYNDKDIPLDYVIKLDSSLQDYQAASINRVQLCDEDTFKGEVLPDSVYMARLASIPSIMELCYNSIVRDYINLYTVRKRKLTSFILGQRDYYFDMFTDALDSEGMPLELRNLAVIESALNPKAYSPAGASGLWQFISSTGSMYGLKINSLVDERRDPVRSTRAAAKYLKHLYGIYNDWTLVIAAYNCGPGNVNKAIRRAGGSKDYWVIYEYLPKETRGYVPAFIAANYVMNYYQEHNICPKTINRPIAVDTVQVRDKVHLKQIADVLDIDMETLRTLNPQYRKDIIPGGYPYTLTLPANKLTQYEMYRNTILAYEVPGYNKNRIYVEPTHHYVAAANTKNKKKKPVKQGEKEQIADSTKLMPADSIAPVEQNVEKMLASNQPIAKAKNVTAKQTNKNSVSATKAKEKEADKNKTKQQEETGSKSEVVEQYKVKQGDTLYSIAHNKHVTVVKLRKWNSLSNDNLRIGQTILVKKQK